MNERYHRNLSIAMVAFLTSALCPPTAAAVGPPAIDDTFLPAPARPAPPQPTYQFAPCTAMTLDPLSSAPPGSTKPALAAIWRLSRGKGQRIGVIDTGVTPHRRLPNLIGGGDYVSVSDGTSDCDGHGTIIAGIIAASPDPDDPSGFSGIAPEATLISIRQSSTKFGVRSARTGTGMGDVRSLAMAVRTMADMGASVINISAGACSDQPPDDRALGAALAYAVDIKDAVIVSAAGNFSDTAKHAGRCTAQNSSAIPIVFTTPAWYDDYVMTVGSVNAEGLPSIFSLHGPWVDIAAPGENITSLSLDGQGVINRISDSAGTTAMSHPISSPISGTDYAAPVVTGIAALIRSRFPQLSAHEVMDRIRHTAQISSAGMDLAIGDGIVNPSAALSDEIATDSESSTASPTTRRLPDNSPQPTPGFFDLPAVAGAATCLALMAAIGLCSRSSRRDRQVTDQLTSNA